MAKRYVCPVCGVASNAPGRMSTDDVRRFCLPCSKEDGKLVPLRCPARAKANKRKREARKNGRAHV